MEAVEGEDITVLQVGGRGEACLYEGDGRAVDRGAPVWPRERLPRDFSAVMPGCIASLRAWAQGGSTNRRNVRG